MRFLLAFILLPLIEIALFVQVGRWLGLWPVLGLVLAAAALGLAVLATGRNRTLGDLQQALNHERDPAAPLADGALRMVGGLLLIAPGFATDAMGLFLLVPGLRGALLRRILVPVPTGRARHPGAAGDVIDGEFEVHDPRPDSPWRDDGAPPLTQDRWPPEKRPPEKRPPEKRPPEKRH